VARKGAILVDTTEKISAPPDLGDTREELLTFKTAKRTASHAVVDAVMRAFAPA
jgi:hypothetical protein